MAEEKQIIHLFNGEKDEWPTFKARFMALATKKEYDEILTGEVVVPITTYDGNGRRNAPADDVAERLLKLSKTAYSDLLNIIQPKTEKGRRAFDMVDSH